MPRGALTIVFDDAVCAHEKNRGTRRGHRGKHTARIFHYSSASDARIDLAIAA